MPGPPRSYIVLINAADADGKLKNYARHDYIYKIWCVCVCVVCISARESKHGFEINSTTIYKAYPGIIIIFLLLPSVFSSII